jgi:hypothetical protein
MTEKKRALSTDCLAFRAALPMFARGPQTKEGVLLLADFGHTAILQSKRLETAMKSGWLVEIGGLIHLSEYAMHYFEGTEPEPQAPKPPTGSLATPRENLHAMEPLSRKHFLNVKGPRADAPDVRAYPSIYAKVTP